ncbi:hypothetical protein QZJ86_14700 [Methylomonas montana]|uniref:hypothetical protein n=1 Tax=Methylomonas montana TaxID=3058963 RepID=UPI00265A2440|nr:hypothetical protein [Methylomonas montana]WKJ89267.1 hypothetical protein QZJ86_14700 [Methylomonas montana]
MSDQAFLKTCAREFKRCAISLCLIIVGLFLATQNAPAAGAAPLPIQNQIDGRGISPMEHPTIFQFH